MTNEWRDYSDCAPKTNGRYLVTVKFAGKMTVYVRAYNDGAFVGDDMNVVAWMPLPEAFKEKTEERDTASFPTVSPFAEKPIDYDRYGNPIFDDYDYFDYEGWERDRTRKDIFEPFRELDKHGILDTIRPTC